jgi:hypothetical protein
MAYGWILTLIAAVVGVSAMLAALGFKGRVTSTFTFKS